MANKISALWVEADQRFAFGLAGEGSIELTKEQFVALMDGQARGQQIERGQDGLPILIDPPVYVPTTEDHLESIAARRYEAETSGTTVEGMPVNTERDSQALLTGAALQAMIDPNYTVRWKTAGGFVGLDAQQIIGLASAVRAHVQACFDREAELVAAVEDGSYTEEMLSAGWP